MKKKWLISALAALTLTAGTGIVYATEVKGTKAEKIKYTNNGQVVSPSSPAVNIDGSLYLPREEYGVA